MKVEITFLRSKIARRLFFLFISASLIPLSLLAYFSFQYMQLSAENTTQKQLSNSTQHYAHALYNRLLLADRALTQHTLYLADNPHLDTGIEPLHDLFSTLTIVDNQGIDKQILDANPFRPILTEAQNRHLNRKQTLLLVSSPPSTHPTMLRQVSSSNHSHWLIATLKPEFLWGSKESFNGQLKVCILNAETRLFCSASQVDESFIASFMTPKNKSVGYYEWSNGKNNLLISFWGLFIKPKFFADQWTIVIAQSKTDALQSNRAFTKIFAAIVVLTLLIVTFISIVQIRRNMVPLEALMEGIKRIGTEDFSLPVQVHSQDEFGQLAHSFNAMSTRLSRQLEVLSSLAEIDKLIISRIKTGDILQIIMSWTNKIIVSDITSVGLLDKKIINKIKIYTKDSNSRTGVSEDEFPINQTILSRLAKKRVLRLHNKQLLPDFFQPLTQRKAKHFLVFPITFNKKLSALLILGYPRPPDFTDNDIRWARDYADRISVALANASWEKQLYFQAHYDVLTTLPNRQLLIDRLEQTITQAALKKHHCAVLFIDLDRFKSVNDSLGHTLGDQLLKIISKRITQAIPKTNTLARLGGDEFIVILPGIITNESASLSAANTATTVLKTISEPLKLLNHQLRMTASVGIALYPVDGINVETLIKNADTAMYHAKDMGKGNFQFYSEQLNASTLKRLVLEADLQQAIEQHEFEVYYQPKVEAHSGRIIAAEALIRWPHPEKGMIYPDEFIPVAEETGQIIPMDKWVIQTVCRQNKQWQKQGFAKIRIAANLSAKQFVDDDLIDFIAQSLKDSQLSADFLELEITESAAMGDMQKTLDILHGLKNLGIALSIDDYGTGYSSLGYIKQFPVDTLKIDQSFIRNIMESDKDQAIVKSTIALAHALNFMVIAEGVETQEHQVLLEQMGCDQFQGYYFSKPLPRTEFEALLRQGTLPYSYQNTKEDPLPRLSHKKFACLSIASRLEGESANFSISA